MTMIKHFSELAVWQKADEAAHSVFDMTSSFPKQYLFDLTSQLRRAALSVPTNIVEGSASNHTRELLQFLNIARRSVRETQYLLLFSFRRELITTAQHETATTSYEHIHRMLSALTRSLRRSP